MYDQKTITSINEDIKQFPQIYPITDKMKQTFSGIQRMVMLDRYSFKDMEKKTLKEGDTVVLTSVFHPKHPTRAIGQIKSINWLDNTAEIELPKEYSSSLPVDSERESGIVHRSLDVIDKPLELYYEQIALRNAKGLSSVEKTYEKKEYWRKEFNRELNELNFIPAGRVLYGAGSETDVTYFNCYVMPFIKDSRGGIEDHRKQVMEIMSRGGGVGTNGSTLRPRASLARGVNGKASGSVSWLHDLSQLTHLVEQGGSRRGAQMIMLSDWHPDIIEFIISKVQKPMILKHLANSDDSEIAKIANQKLKFKAYSDKEIRMFELIANNEYADHDLIEDAKQKLNNGGEYSVNDPEYLSGANISVCITKEFMEAVDNDDHYDLRFPDTDSYDENEMKEYDEKWHEYGDVREWEKLGFRIKTHRRIKAKELWNLINICATYSAEPGIFFIDNANEKTNAKAYGQKVVATNPCGEQPLAPFSVCNLAAVNLANMADRSNKKVDFEKLKRTVSVGVRMQDNVIDSTPYFLDENKKQALGERRIGMGVMGLHDLLIYCEKKYGSKEGNNLIDEIFETIAQTAYRTSIELAKEKGSFPFLQDESASSFEIDTTIPRENRTTLGNKEKFINSGYMKNMPEDIREDVLKHGIRNSHLLTVAPTGSTGTMAGVSTGLEPYFSFSYYRSGRLGKFIKVNAKIVEDYLEDNPDVDPNNLPDWFVTAMSLQPEDHADTQCVIQKHVDSSLSKTVNAPKGFSVKQVAELYKRLYEGGAKGGTVYVDGSRDAQVLTLTDVDNDMSDDNSDYEYESQNEENVAYQRSVAADVEDSSVERKIGSEVGDICPVCKVGQVEEFGGCNTCTNCNAQLKCGL